MLCSAQPIPFKVFGRGWEGEKRRQRGRGGGEGGGRAAGGGGGKTLRTRRAKEKLNECFDAENL